MMKHETDRCWALGPCVSLLALACAGCPGTDTVECGNGLRCPPGTSCSAAGDTCIADGCGDGVVDDREECDDGNLASRDGCSALCTVEDVPFADVEFVFVSGSDGRMGRAVAVDGATAAIGSSVGTEGDRVHVWVRQDEIWSEQDVLAVDGPPGDQFGAALGLSGDALVVGAHGTAPGGAAYVFERIGQSWGAGIRLVAATDTHQFGFAVAVSGSVALVGAPVPEGERGQDAAYVFERREGGWDEAARLIGPAGRKDPGELGAAVAIDGDIAVVGAPGTDHGPVGDEGLVYVFERDGADWGSGVALIPSTHEPGDRYGHAVAISEHTIVVSAPGSDVAASDAGAVYVFERRGSSWVETAVLVADDAATGDGLGRALSFDGFAIVVDPGVRSDLPVHVFRRALDEWVRSEAFACDDPAGEGLGRAVAVSDQHLVIGVPGVAAGFALLFERGAMCAGMRAPALGHPGPARGAADHLAAR